jgi:hypothetical protein
MFFTSNVFHHNVFHRQCFSLAMFFTIKVIHHIDIIVSNLMFYFRWLPVVDCAGRQHQSPLCAGLHLPLVS